MYAKHHEQSIHKSRTVQKPTASLLTTMTGESYQPARIYYQVGQKNPARFCQKLLY
ncbi:hypothetical protein IQ255_09100 [Pleurocapsales cyanobacterium LEGE 10410]|nr:hypothetical protein [Pleurocapsales cyanobacterium LEGE 10410]